MDILVFLAGLVTGLIVGGIIGYWLFYFRAMWGMKNYF